MGLYDRPRESSRPATSRAKARRHLPLKSRLDLELDERCRPRPDARFSPKEIEVPPDRAASSERDLERFEAGVTRLRTDAVLAVLNPCVVHLQLPLGGYDIFGAVTFVKEISEDAKFPIVSWIINQSGFWEDAFQTQVVGEKPDDTTAGSDDRILVNREAHSDHGKNFVFY